MKRLLTWLPYVGLLTLGLIFAVRRFDPVGLDLIDLPNPPRASMGTLDLAPLPSSLAGRVTVDGDVAVSEALVMVDLNGELVWAYTDPQGQFTLERLPPGRITVSVVRRKFAPQDFEVTAPDGELVLELTSPTAAPPVLPDIAESDFGGEVVAAIPGRGLLEYEVQLVPVDPPDVFGAPIPVRTRVGADRRFSFPGLLHGAYKVRVLPPWAAGGSWPNLVAEASAVFVHGPASKASAFQLAGGEIAGRLIDSRGRPVHGGLIRVAPVGEPERPWIPVASTKSGSFLIQDLPPGPYLLQVDVGETSFEQEIDVIARATSQVDVPPLALGAEK